MHQTQLQYLSLLICIVGFSIGPAMFIFQRLLIFEQTLVLMIYVILHAISLFGWRGAALHLSTACILTAVIEGIGVNTGLIFGDYTFITNDYGAHVLNLPVGVPIVWAVWFYHMFIVSKLVVGDPLQPSFTQRRTFFRRIICTIFSSLIYTGLNSLSDPLYSSLGGTHFMFPQIWIWNPDKEFPVSSTSSNFKMELAQDVLKHKDVTLPILSGQPITRYFKDPEIYYNHFGVPVQNCVGWFFATSIIFFSLYTLEDLELIQKRVLSTPPRITHLDALPLYYFIVCGILFGLTPQAPITIRMFSVFLFLPLTLIAIDRLLNQDKPKTQ